LTLSFEWHQEKSEENLKKHGVNFDEAKTVFNDPSAITIYDPDHSAEEDRFVDIGFSCNGRLLVISYTERGRNIRIISCRTANKKETLAYENK